MKIVFVIILLVICLASCDKNKELIKYSEYYHIENGDTLSYIFIPNTFTPDQDGFNDYFKIIGSGFVYPNFNVKIFNQAGQIIYASDNLDAYWDGTYKGLQAQSEEYHYLINAVDFTGYEFEITGVVSLLE